MSQSIPTYPDRHHPVYFVLDALIALGASAEFAKDERTENTWGMVVNGRVVSYLIDNRWDHEKAHEDLAAERLLSHGALVCNAQKPDAERNGGRWLPLAATPGYRPIKTPKTHDVAFVGYVRDPARATLLIDMNCHHSLHWGRNLFGDAAVEAYCAARVGLNIPTRFGDPDAYDVNMRVLEIATTGTPLVTNHLSDLHDLGFEDSVNCYLYESADECLRAVDVALRDPHALRVGARAAALVSEKHTYCHRAKQVLEWLK